MKLSNTTEAAKKTYEQRQKDCEIIKQLREELIKNKKENDELRLAIKKLKYLLMFIQ